MTSFKRRYKAEGSPELADRAGSGKINDTHQRMQRIMVYHFIVFGNTFDKINLIFHIFNSSETKITIFKTQILRSR